MKVCRAVRVILMILLAVSMLAANAYADESYANWNEVVQAMNAELQKGNELYGAGDADGAYKQVNTAYYQYYEKLGFERTVKMFISGSRASAVELQFAKCKSTIKGNPEAAEVQTQLETLSSMLAEDAEKLDGTSAGSVVTLEQILSGEAESTGTASADTSSATDTSAQSSGSVGVNGGASGGWLTFTACFGIILREGFEAILVVGAIIAYLVKSGNKDKLRAVYFGSALAIFASFASAWLLNALLLANSASQEIIEGITALIAVVVLFYVSNWMVSKSESENWSRYIENQVSGSVEKGSLFTLGFTAFLAVYREGAEVILFYQPLLADKANTGMVWAGFGVGCVILVIIYLAIRFLSVKLPLKPFFLGTSILMFVMSISFLGSGIKELIEGDVITMTSPDILVALIPSNEFFEVLGIYPIVETLVPQLILIFITLAIFVMQKWDRTNKNEAGVLAILFGGLGLHKFYVGRYGQGIIYAALSWTFIPMFIAIIEGVHYICGNKESFLKNVSSEVLAAKNAVAAE